MTENQELAQLLYPGLNNTPGYYEELYPPRNLPEGAIVSRYAPSPTGFIHLGALYASLISCRMAKQSAGVSMLRIEDTDKKREIADGVTEIVTSLHTFGIEFDEGPVDLHHEKGAYGPYKQSERGIVYRTFAKLLIFKGMAYPCFCTEEDIDNIRHKQEEQKAATGYYGQWAVHRNFTLAQVKEELARGKPFIIRFRSPGNTAKKFTHKDLIKGRIEMYESDQDLVIIKSDGLPTYHFAHVVDDHFMRTTHVIRGDEWLPSVPLHVQLFRALEWEMPHFCHIAPIVKEDGTSKRKLSKRKDPEAAIRYYHEQGYPKAAIIEYLMNLAHSGFEDWRKANPRADYRTFKLDFKKMTISGSLFDLAKLADISKNVISLLSAEEVLAETLKWADEFDRTLYVILSRDKDYSRAILAIDRNVPKPRKDIARWPDVRHYLAYFFDELLADENPAARYEFPDNLASREMLEILTLYLGGYFTLDDKTVWFDRIRQMSESLGYAGDMKAFRSNPGAFKGHVGDVTTVLRVAVTGRKNSPDLYEIQKIMDRAMVMKRYQECMEVLKAR